MATKKDKMESVVSTSTKASTSSVARATKKKAVVPPVLSEDSSSTSVVGTVDSVVSDSKSGKVVAKTQKAHNSLVKKGKKVIADGSKSKQKTLSSSFRVIAKKKAVVVEVPHRPNIVLSSMTRAHQAKVLGNGILGVPKLSAGDGNLKDFAHFIGKRKSAVAKVWINRARRDGNGFVIMNNEDCLSYFVGSVKFLSRIAEAFAVVGENVDNYAVFASLSGGGKSAQAEAIRLAVARFFASSSDSFRFALKSAGLLTRDSREVESKVIGYRKARKKEQFSKR